MKWHFRCLAIAVVAVSWVIFSAVDSRSLADAAHMPGFDEKQKIEGRNETGCVEVTEAKWGASECKDPESLAVRAKLKCNKADVRICIQKVKGQWLCGEFPGKSAGDEISFYGCEAKGKYAIYKRDVGSGKAWPKP